MADLLGFLLPDWVAALGIFIGSIVLAEGVIVTVDKLIRPLLSKTKTVLDDYLFENLRGPLKLLFSVFGAYYGIKLLSNDFQVWGYSLDALLGFVLIVSVGHAVARALSAILKWYVHEIGIQQKSRVGDVFPILSKILKAAVYFGTLIVLLSELGVEIGPLIAGLGVAGLAVALALQDSLKNFFAGVYLLADKPIRQGDIIALDSDKSEIKGTVEEIGWRATRIRGVANAIHIIPNEKLAQSVIVNYSKGRDTRTLMVKVGVQYAEDAQKALDALKKAADEAIASSPAADQSVPAEVRINEFLDSSVELAAMVRVKDYGERFKVATELRKNILRMFKKQGIEIPFPIRTLHLHDGRVAQKGKHKVKKAE